MTTWEYTMVEGAFDAIREKNSLISKLDAAGQEGWELVCTERKAGSIVLIQAILKRKKE